MNIYNLDVIQKFVQQVYTSPTTQQPVGISQLQLIPYFYTLTFTGLAQNGTQTQQLSINADADFVLTGFGYHVSIGAVQTATNMTIPFIRMLITDSATNQPFMNGPVDLSVISRSPLGDEVAMPYPRLVAGRSSLTVQVSNYAPAAETYAFDLLLHGVAVKIYG